MIYKKKSSIFFSSNTSAKAQQEVTREVRGTISGNYDKYLGLPSLIGKFKYNSLDRLKKEFDRKFQIGNKSFSLKPKEKLL